MQGSLKHDATPAGASFEAPHAHVMPPRILIGVFLSLLALTLVTVLAAGWDLGRLEIWTSLGIATVKAALVALYFMHLRYDKSYYSLAFVLAIACVGLFLALTLADVDAYQGEMAPPPAPDG